MMKYFWMIYKNKVLQNKKTKEFGFREIQKKENKNLRAIILLHKHFPKRKLENKEIGTQHNYLGIERK